MTEHDPRPEHDKCANCGHPRFEHFQSAGYCEVDDFREGICMCAAFVKFTRIEAAR